MNNYIHVVSDIRFGIVDAGDTGINQRGQTFRGGEQFYAAIRDLHVRIHIHISRAVVDPLYVLREIH